MAKPTININGKNYHPVAPKARVWREITKFDNERPGLPDVEFIDAHIGIIATVFNNPEITPDIILDNLDIDEIIPLYYETFRWIVEMLNNKLSKIPNEVVETSIETK